MSKIPTAKEFLDDYSKNVKQHFLGFNKEYEETYREYAIRNPLPTMENTLIEYTKLHVKAALEEALDCVPYGGSDSISYDDVKGILTCYPPENIK